MYGYYIDCPGCGFKIPTDAIECNCGWDARGTIEMVRYKGYMIDVYYDSDRGGTVYLVTCLKDEGIINELFSGGQMDTEAEVEKTIAFLRDQIDLSR